MEDSPRPPKLSVVIPAYNEAHRLPESLRQLHAWLNDQPYSSEVIVVDDGSTDGTANVVRAAMVDWPTLSLQTASHAGKGAAVRDGARAARGEFVAFADADFSMPVHELERLRAVAEEIAGIAIASREASGARRYGEPWYRHAMGRVFNRIVQILVLPGIQDTQCGFKCMPHEIALTLCKQQTIPGWGFDVELLAIARRHGFAIRETPIPWYYMANSRVRLGRDTFNMLREALTIRTKMLKGEYDPTGFSAGGSNATLLEMRNTHAS
jgi:glycosyltransferase involved in cell wall biosynthesis